MNDEIEKSFNRLKSLVLNDVLEQSRQREEELEKKNEDILSGKKSEYMNIAQKRTKSILTRTERETRSEILKAELEARTELSEFRESLVDAVFEGVFEKLSEYIKTDEYTAWLLDKARQALGECGEGEKILMANTSDCPKLEKLGNKLRACDILGGVKAVNEERGIICDYSLDGMIEESRRGFLKKSGLKIGN
ncbi:MAG: V-type ATP synthase subunit E [Clostridiales bacterium]|nr:V-type ATP synthase subunit E [Clostridiales bacterium]